MKYPLLALLSGNCTRRLVAALLLPCNSRLRGAHPDRLYEWYLQRLFEPSSQQLAVEATGRVQLYSGLKGSDVARALDEQFERIDAMMFTGTLVTDPKGQPVKDPEAGEVLVENDGCQRRRLVAWKNHL